MLLGSYRLDQWLLGAIAGPRELGVYSVAVAWAEALWYLPTALAAVQRPDLVRAAKDRAAWIAAADFPRGHGRDGRLCTRDVRRRADPLRHDFR